MYHRLEGQSNREGTFREYHSGYIISSPSGRPRHRHSNWHAVLLMKAHCPSRTWMFSIAYINVASLATKSGLFWKMWTCRNRWQIWKVVLWAFQLAWASIQVWQRCTRVCRSRQKAWARNPPTTQALSRAWTSWFALVWDRLFEVYEWRAERRKITLKPYHAMGWTI